MAPKLTRSAKHSHDRKEGRVIDGHLQTEVVSDLSGDEGSTMSASSSSSRIRSRFGRNKRLGKKKNTVSGGTHSAGDYSSSAASKPTSATTATTATSSTRASSRTTSKTPSKSSATGPAVDEKKLTKDAKSRFNIGLVYLKTKDFAKAQENLEHSLYCHLQLAGNNSKMYTSESLFTIASVREKLGDCLIENTAIVDKGQALDHYDEARRLLENLDPEDAPPNLTEMKVRITGKIKSSGDLASGPRRLPSQGSPLPRKTERKTRQERDIGSSGTRRNERSRSLDSSDSSMTGGRRHRSSNDKTQGSRDIAVRGSGDKKQDEDFFLWEVRRGIHRGVKKTVAGGVNVLKDGVEVFTDVLEDAFEGVENVVENVVDHVKGDDSSACGSKWGRNSGSGSSIAMEEFDLVSVHLERENHRTALNHLSNLSSQNTQNADLSFRIQLVEYLVKVGFSAQKAGKIGTSTDAFEEAFTIMRRDEMEDIDTQAPKKIMRGCIKGHKLLAIEEEKAEQYEDSIQHRNRVCQLLAMNGRTVAECQQKEKIAYLHGQMENYEACLGAIDEAIKILFAGAEDIDGVPKEHIPHLIRCYRMRAVCHSKMRKWKRSYDQYLQVLPLIARQEGLSSKEYNTVLIEMGVLLATMGEYNKATEQMEEYFKLSEGKEDLLVSESDHIVALDTCVVSHLKDEDIDSAITMLEKKLEFVETLPKNDEMKSETMHKLGCLLAYKKCHQQALPLLTAALDTRKHLYDKKNKFLLASSWAVAATSQTLGKNDAALKEYVTLMERMGKSNDSPVNSVVVNNSAGRLFFENGQIDKAVKSFRDALKGVDSAGNSSLKCDVLLNLANALSAKGDTDGALRLFSDLRKIPGVKRSKLHFTALYNQCLLLVKKGSTEDAKQILQEIALNRSTESSEVKGNVYLTLGNISLSDGDVEEAMDNFKESLSIFDAEGADISSVTQAKKSIGMAYFESGQLDKAISTFEEVLEQLSQPGMESKKVNLLKADIWSCMGRVHQKNGDLSSAKHFSRLALQSYKTDLGENNPVTLRMSSNLAVLLLDEAANLPKAQSKPIIDGARFEMEEALERFISLNDLWTYRLDVATLKTNLGFVATWQGKPKKAKKLLRQVREIEIPKNHPLEKRVALLGQRVEGSR